MRLVDHETTRIVVRSLLIRFSCLFRVTELFQDNLQALLITGVDPVAAGWQLREISEKTRGKAPELFEHLLDILQIPDSHIVLLYERHIAAISILVIVLTSPTIKWILNSRFLKLLGSLQYSVFLIQPSVTCGLEDLLPIL